MFDLIQTVDKPIHRCGHILDWILHRRDYEIIQTTHVSHELTSDHFTIICGLDLLAWRQPPSFISKRNLCSVDNCSLVQDIKQCLDPSVMFTAEQLDSILRLLLDKHAPITVLRYLRRNVPISTTVLVMHFELQTSRRKKM